MTIGAVGSPDGGVFTQLQLARRRRRCSPIVDLVGNLRGVQDETQAPPRFHCGISVPWSVAPLSRDAAQEGMLLQAPENVTACCYLELCDAHEHI